VVQERQLRKSIAEMHDGHRAQINAVMDKYQSLLAHVSHLVLSTNKTYSCVLDYFESCHDCCPVADSKIVVEIDMLPTSSCLHSGMLSLQLLAAGTLLGEACVFMPCGEQQLIRVADAGEGVP
jgi:hypothetical protein